MRQAFNLAYDFEWANKNLFYGQYARVGSYFEDGELAAPGAARGARARDLERGQGRRAAGSVHRRPPNPVNDKPDDMRDNLRKAVTLLKEAGWEVKNGALTNVKTGAADDRSSSCS